MSSSIASMKTIAYRGSFDKCQLAVKVESIEFTGQDAKITLVDPTGSIGSTVLEEVFREGNFNIKEGTVLYLTDYSSFCIHSEKKMVTMLTSTLVCT